MVNPGLCSFGHFGLRIRTSCLATIVVSLRDKNHPPIEAPGINLALMLVLPGSGLGELPPSIG
jgi:hypothetical protein